MDITIETARTTIKRAHTALIEQYDLREGDYIAVEYRGSLNHPYKAQAAVVEDGMLIVGGCLPSMGMIGQVLTLPWRYGSVDHPIEILAGGQHYCTMTKTRVAILADGSRLWRGKIGCGVVWLTGEGEQRSDVITEALRRTPQPNPIPKPSRA